MYHTQQRSNNLNQTLAYEARLNRIHRLFKTHFNVTEPSMVMEPYLFLGNCISAHDINRLTRLGIRYVLNVAIRDVEVCPYYSKDVRTLTIDLRDDDRENILRTFDQAFAFIDEARRDKSRVLVHCSHGQSRSPAIVIAYLMRSYHVSLEQCLMHVIKARPCVIPNDGFLKQLILYDRFLVERRRQQQLKQQQQMQQELARQQAAQSAASTELAVQHHQPAVVSETVQTNVVVSPQTPPQTSVSPNTNLTHITSVDSTSIGASSVSSIESSASTNSVHVIPIQVSRSKKTEPIPIKQASADDMLTKLESKKYVDRGQNEAISKTSSTNSTKPPLDLSSSQKVLPTQSSLNNVIKKDTDQSFIQVHRSSTSDLLIANSHQHYQQAPMNLTQQQWNFINQYPPTFFGSNEPMPTKYITEIYDRATNRFIPTTCCY